MTARHKLNQSYFNGVLLIAGVVAFLIGSWEIFVVLLVLLTIAAILGGQIRFFKRGR